MLEISKDFYVAQAFREEFELLKAFISQQEIQINEYANSIDTKIEKVEVEKSLFTSQRGTQTVASEVKHIEGITDDDYDIKALFTEVMPAYQRQAMLVTLWARLENKLDDLVSHLATSQNKRRRKKPRGKSDFEHLTNEVERFWVSLRNDEKVLAAIDLLNNEVRHIRNSWVHNGGKSCNASVRQAAQLNKYLFLYKGTINIEKGYLDSVLNAMSCISCYVFSALVEAESR